MAIEEKDQRLIDLYIKYPTELKTRKKKDAVVRVRSKPLEQKRNVKSPKSPQSKIAMTVASNKVLSTSKSISSDKSKNDNSRKQTVQDKGKISASKLRGKKK